MPQLAGRSQSGSVGTLGDGSGGSGHFLNTPQMQRSATSPYGGESLLLTHSLTRPSAQSAAAPVALRTPAPSTEQPHAQLCWR
jgi:hypothetical protein